MKSITIMGALAALALGLAFAPVASAQNLYVKATVGQTADTQASGISLSDDLSYGVAIGGDVGPVRLEIGVDHLAANLGGVVDATAIDYSATVYYGQPISERSTVFVGAGVDYLDATVSYGPFSTDGSGDGWHYTFGYARTLAPGVTLELSARHIEADLEFSGYGIDAEANVFSIGGRVAL